MLAIQTHPHSYSTFVASRPPAETCLLGTVPWRRLVGGGAWTRPYYSGVVSHSGGLAGRLPGRVSGDVSRGESGVLHGGCILSWPNVGVKLPGSKYLPHIGSVSPASPADLSITLPPGATTSRTIIFSIRTGTTFQHPVRNRFSHKTRFLSLPKAR